MELPELDVEPRPMQGQLASHLPGSDPGERPEPIERGLDRSTLQREPALVWLSCGDDRGVLREDPDVAHPRPEEVRRREGRLLGEGGPDATAAPVAEDHDR